MFIKKIFVAKTLTACGTWWLLNGIGPRSLSDGLWGRTLSSAASWWSCYNAHHTHRIDPRGYQKPLNHENIPETNELDSDVSIIQSLASTSFWPQRTDRQNFFEKNSLKSKKSKKSKKLKN